MATSSDADCIEMAEVGALSPSPPKLRSLRPASFVSLGAIQDASNVLGDLEWTGTPPELNW